MDSLRILTKVITLRLPNNTDRQFLPPNYDSVSINTRVGQCYYCI